jgi:16S rRNA (uracil1498-N3)-methyltransferase
MQRYFIEPAQFHDEFVEITGDDARQLTRVLRAEAGMKVIASDGISREALVELTEISKETVTARIVELVPMDREPAVQVWIAQSLPKADKMETVIQKGTEIGATRFIPFVSDRTIVQLDAKKESKKMERWQKIAKEAAEQAHRNRVPLVEQPYRWKELLELAKQADSALFCYEKEDGSMLRTAVNAAIEAKHASGERTQPLTIMLIVGPEGGFTEQEAAEAEQGGCAIVSLGKRILRTETAAMVGLTCILYETGEMGGA